MATDESTSFWAALYAWIKAWFTSTSTPTPEPEPEPEPVPEPEPTPEPEPEPTPEPAPAKYTAKERDAFLKAMGYPTGKAGTVAFQRASTWHLYDDAAKKVGALSEDGDFGSKTTAHAKAAIKAGHQIAPNFKAAEFDCPCGGKYSGCKVHFIRWEVVQIAQYIRDHVVKGPLAILVGYRCPTHNKKIGGRTSPPSAHTTGGAFDFTTGYKVKPSTLKTLATKGTLSRLKGIGFQKANGYTSHCDVSEKSVVIFGEGTGSAKAK